VIINYSSALLALEINPHIIVNICVFSEVLQQVKKCMGDLGTVCKGNSRYSSLVQATEAKEEECSQTVSQGIHKSLIENVMKDNFVLNELF
jgi:hypothetical protein